MKRAWVFQDRKQLRKYGPERAAWCVGRYDHDGKQRSKSCGPGRKGKRQAETLQRQREGEFAAGTYRSANRMTWEEFRKEFEQKVPAGKRPQTQDAYKFCLNNFEKAIKPNLLRSITSRTISQFIAVRQGQAGLKAETKTSPVTINKELRHLRSALRKAVAWELLERMPQIEFLREPGKIATFVSDEHLALIYAACDKARRPTFRKATFTAGAWWQALLTTAFLTGWRIGSLLSLRWSNIDTEHRQILLPAEDAKGNRDQLIPLHDVVLEHIKPIQLPGEDRVFVWGFTRRALYAEFFRIQRAAGIKPARKAYYGFHDLRRGFATYNADRMTADALQALMGHCDYQTTKRYINLARQLNPASNNVFVPPALRKKRS